eukprot:6230747-Prymnesium_polylepis.2
MSGKVPSEGAGAERANVWQGSQGRVRRSEALRTFAYRHVTALWLASGKRRGAVALTMEWARRDDLGRKRRAETGANFCVTVSCGH